MRTLMSFSLIALLFAAGCSKSNDVSVTNPGDNQLKSARTATPFGVFNDNDVLRSAIFYPPASYTYPFVVWSDYNFTGYSASNYDLMAHFMYKSPVAVTGAVVEFTFPHIRYFVPHITNKSEERVYTVNNENNQTVISCTTNLVAGPNPMFCFIVKIDCSNGNNGLTTFWTDMKVNGVSVKGSIKNKVFACN